LVWLDGWLIGRWLCVLLWWFGSVCFVLLDYLVGLVWLVGRLMWFGQFDLVGWFG